MRNRVGVILIISKYYGQLAGVGFITGNDDFSSMSKEPRPCIIDYEACFSAKHFADIYYES